MSDNLRVTWSLGRGHWDGGHAGSWASSWDRRRMQGGAGAFGLWPEEGGSWVSRRGPERRALAERPHGVSTASAERLGCILGR